jgi:MarR family transcriptional regulator, 2-MHQ and catechol-resistance regulon repressor
VSTSANECIVGIVRAGEAFMALANRALSGYQLSPAARQALAVLDGAGEPLSPTEIARRLIVTTASVTSLLDTLERRGLVERRPDPADRRRLLVAITPPAQAMVRQYVPEVVALQGAVMSGIGEEDRQQLITILTRIREAIAAASP